ncbi:MAG TPA: hypothetical protein VF455_08425 [Chryseobacterium sp.]
MNHLQPDLSGNPFLAIELVEIAKKRLGAEGGKSCPKLTQWFDVVK